MTLPAVVLVHGGGKAGDSWDLIVEEIHRLAPDLTMLDPDMPGRRNKPGDLREMTIAAYVDSLVADIESAGNRSRPAKVLGLGAFCYCRRALADLHFRRKVSRRWAGWDC
jgi:pimeloyl-ACP methyl ester carboxylesterase